MDIVGIISLIDGVCHNNEVSFEDYTFLLKKGKENNYSESIIESLIQAKGITILATKSKIETDKVLDDLNAEIRKKIKELYDTNKKGLIIEFFEEKLTATQDYVLINYYLKSLISEIQYKKALDQSRKLMNPTIAANLEIKKTLGTIYLRNSKHELAYELYEDLMTSLPSLAQDNLDNLINSMLNSGEFDLLKRCRRNSNYSSITRTKLTEFFEKKNYTFFIELFELEDEFAKDETFIKNYIWSLYKNDGTELKAYEKGNYYLKLISTPSSLSYSMGVICSFLKKWLEAYDYFQQCLSRGMDVQENIDKIIDKLIIEENWESLIKLKDSINYLIKIESAFSHLSDGDNYPSIVKIFEALFSDTNDTYKIKKYVYSLSKSDTIRSLIKYNHFNSFFESADDKYWIRLGGKIYENKKDYETALVYYEKASKLENGYCFDDIKRVNFILNPALHFNELLKELKYKEAAQLFEDKLIRTSDGDIIKDYITALIKMGDSEDKIIQKAIAFAKNSDNGHVLYETIGTLSMKIKNYQQAKEYYTKAKNRGHNVALKLQEVELILSKVEFEKQKQLEKQEQQKRAELNSVVKSASINREETIHQQVSEVQKSSIGSHSFKSSVSRGGDVIFPEHIRINDQELSWEKKTGVFSKDSKTIPIQEITQIDIEKSLVGATIKIRSKGSGFIEAQNFTKSDVKQIKSLIEKAQNLR